MILRAMADDDEQLAALGALRSDDSTDHDADDDHDGDDLDPHAPPSEASEPIAKPEDAWIEMGTRPIARSAEGIDPVINVLEILPPFEFSV
jgi:hypothetical protein